MPAADTALPCPLYPIVNLRSADDDETQRCLELAVALAAEGVGLLQLRAKSVGAGAFTELATALTPRLREHDCRLIVNDRVDVAAAAGAAGVHLGDEDLGVASARRILGENAILGYSTHSVADVHAAAKLPADYLGFGPVYDSPTKAGVRTPRGLETLEAACAAATVPVVAIGGITAGNAADVWAAGAASVAVIRDLESADAPRAHARGYLELARRQGRG